jgi:hypothetical protein
MLTARAAAWQDCETTFSQGGGQVTQLQIPGYRSGQFGEHRLLDWFHVDHGFLLLGGIVADQPFSVSIHVTTC